MDNDTFRRIVASERERRIRERRQVRGSSETKRDIEWIAVLVIFIAIWSVIFFH